MLTLRSSGSNAKAVMTLARAENRPASDQPATLVFRRYGSSYFLSKVWGAYSPTGRALDPGKREKELIARGATVQTAGVMAKAK